MPPRQKKKKMELSFIRLCRVNTIMLTLLFSQQGNEDWFWMTSMRKFVGVKVPFSLQFLCQAIIKTLAAVTRNNHHNISNKFILLNNKSALWLCFLYDLVRETLILSCSCLPEKYNCLENTIFTTRLYLDDIGICPNESSISISNFCCRIVIKKRVCH